MNDENPFCAAVGNDTSVAAPTRQAHTPGPWDARWECSAICVGDQTLARVYWSEGRSAAENRANAHLIAAAPEMKEALQSLMNEAAGFLSMADPTAHGQTNLRCLQRRIDAAHDAIAKAEGRQS